jgi:DNA modification methylase
MSVDPQRITWFPLSELSHWERNYRVGHIESIVASIVRFGFNSALKVRERVVMAGNQSLTALQTICANGVPAPRGIEVREGQWFVPCIDVSHLSQREAEAFAIADNRTHDLGEDDPGALAKLLEDVFQELGSFESTGYDAADLEALLHEATQEDRANLEDLGAEDPDEDNFGEIRICKGDLWALGKHRVLCGDATDKVAVQRLLGDQRAALLATDPPYLVDYTGDDRPKAGSGKDWSEHYHEIDIKDGEGFYRSLFESVLPVCRPNVAVYCWHASSRAAMIEAIWAELGIHYHQQIIWRKPVATLGYSFYPWQHEPCLMGWPKGFKPPRDSDFSHAVTTVWEVDWEGKGRLVGNEHPTQKPVELFAIPMRRHTQPGEICFEPFLGSGSQLIAAEKEQRICYAIEIEPRFCEVALRRWEQMTGKAAELVNREVPA